MTTSKLQWHSKCVAWGGLFAWSWDTISSFLKQLALGRQVGKEDPLTIRTLVWPDFKVFWITNSYAQACDSYRSLAKRLHNYLWCTEPLACLSNRQGRDLSSGWQTTIQTEWTAPDPSERQKISSAMHPVMLCLACHVAVTWYWNCWFGWEMSSSVTDFPFLL